MKRILSILFLPLLSLITLFSQDEETLITISGHRISQGEFMRMYRKNNSQGISEKQDIDEYLDLFINFKLKVIEAENLKMDTSAAFKDELDGYVRQLVKPYLNDPGSYEQLLTETYDRMKKEIHASHIMIMLDEKASPEDTLAALNKILKIRDRCLKGEDFPEMAKKYSEDPSVNQNNGDLGWFGVFRMVYPFESTAYNTEQGQISMPVRSHFGYHIIKVHKVRPAKPRLHVAHIFVRAPESMSSEESLLAKTRIFSIYDRLRQGASFEKIAIAESEDKSSGINGGELPWFSSGEMIPDFENAAFKLNEPGEYSQPIQSFYGWHIVKLLEKKELKPYEEERPYIIQMLNNNGRTQLQQKIYISKLKHDHHFTFFPNNYYKIYDLVDTTIFSGKWSRDLTVKNDDVIFTIGNRKVCIADFGNYIYLKQRPVEPCNLNIFIDNQFNTFCESELLDYETELLPEKYPELAHIVKEYHDGILLFDLTDKMVWSKAVQDTMGLEQFYQQNRSNYIWKERAEAFIITGENKDMIEKAGILTEKDGRKKKFTAEYLKKRICPDDISGHCLSFISGKYEKGDNLEVDSTDWRSGTGRYFKKEDETGFVYIKRILRPAIKKPDEARGQIIADYQAFLESEWLKSLKITYHIEINQELLKKLKQSDG